MHRATSGFTLIELLVVVAVIGILASLLMPAMNQAISSGHKAACAGQLRQIGTAFKNYLNQYSQWSHASPNYGLWEKPLGTILPATDPCAYWGVAYAPFLGDDRKVFRCSSALMMWNTAGYADWANQPWATYGLNNYVRNTLVPTKFRKASETILAQDAYEHLLEGNGDMLWIVPGETINLTQWRHIAGAVRSYFRHNDNCNTLWLDCHITSIPLCGDYPKKYYTGE